MDKFVQLKGGTPVYEAYIKTLYLASEPISSLPFLEKIAQARTVWTSKEKAFVF